MKDQILRTALFALGLGLLCLNAQAQFPTQTRPNRNTPPGLPGNRLYNPFRTQFKLDWQYKLDTPVKLIEIGPVAGEKRNNLIMVIGGKNREDYKRQLLVTHWEGFKFVTDYTTEFLGTVPDALLIGRFRETKAAPGPKPAKGGKTPVPAAAQQIATQEGIYEWTGKGFTRLFTGPTNLRLALVLDKTTDLLLSGAGDNSQLYEVNAQQVEPSNREMPLAGGGYVRFGVGLQEFEGAENLDFQSGVRYVQSYWNGRSHWIIGIAKGQPAPTKLAPNATTQDKLVIFTPRYASREKPFWMMKADDFEEAWRSAPIPGRVLDVRVGDPKNENKEGILVLTTENEDQFYRLTFFRTVPQGTPGAQ